MLRPNVHSREVRKGDRVSVSDRPEYASQAWGRQGDVFAMSTWAARPVLSGWQKHSDQQDLRSRCGTRSAAVLDAFSRFNQVHDCASTSDRASIGGRGWRNGRRLVETEKAGAVWVKMPVSLAAAGPTARTPVRAALTGTTRHRTRTTTSGLAASVSARINRSANATAWQADQVKCGQPVLSSHGKYSTWFGITPSRKSNGGADISMPKKHRNLIDRITSIENLRDAYVKTSKGKKMTYGYLQFKEYAEANLLLIQEELQDGAYAIGPYRNFTIFEPKPRLISALDFKDRLVQHALCNVITPIFEATLLPYTFACREGMGTHAGVIHVQKTMRQIGATHFLKTDFSKYFPSVDHAVLHDLIDRKIDCRLTLKILREIIPGSGQGIPIGSLTSQLFANVYGGMVDRHIHDTLGHRHWARYMDDIVVLGHDRSQFQDTFESMSEFASDKMKLTVSKWSIGSVLQGINFLGYRIWHTHKLLRKDSVTRAKRKVAKYVKHDDMESLRKFVASWRGHAQWANTHNLLNWMENRYGIVV